MHLVIKLALLFFIGYCSSGMIDSYMHSSKVDKLSNITSRRCHCGCSAPLYLMQEKEIGFQCDLLTKTKENLKFNFSDFKSTDTLVIAAFVPFNSRNGNCGTYRQIIEEYISTLKIENVAYSEYPLVLNWSDVDVGENDPWYPIFRDEEFRWKNLGKNNFTFEPAFLFYKNGLSVIGLFDFQIRLNWYVNSLNSREIDELNLLNVVDQGIFDMSCDNWVKE